MMALNEEFKKRYKGKDHLAITKVVFLNPPVNIALNKKTYFTHFPAMPDECKVDGCSCELS